MKLPKYRDTSSPSLGGAYTQAITQAQPAMLQPVQRNTQAYLINEKLTGRGTAAQEAAAIASGAYVGDAFAKGMVKVASAFAEADGASQYGTAKQGFSLWDTNHQIKVLGRPFTAKNDDPKRKYERYPTHPTMLDDYIADATTEMNSYAKEIGSKKYRARFLAESANKIQSTAKTLWSYQNKMHMGWLQGEVQSKLFAALSLKEVGEILESPDTLMAHSGKEIQELKETYTRVVSNRWIQNEFLKYQGSSYGMSEFRELVQFAGRKYLRVANPDAPKEDQFNNSGIDEEPDWVEHKRFITTKDVNDWVAKSVAFEKAERAETTAKATKAVGYEALRILRGVETGDLDEGETRVYTETDLEEWVKGHSNTTIAQLGSLRSLIAAKTQPLVGDMGEFAQIRENIQDYTVADIAGNELLSWEQRRALLEKRMSVEHGQVLWEDKNHPSGPWGHRALARLKRAFRIAGLDPTDPNSFLPGAAGAAQADRLNRYQDAVTELEDYLYGPNAGDGKSFEEADMPKAAWEWVLEKEEGFKADTADPVATDSTGDPTTVAVVKSKFQTWQETTGAVKADGTPWTLDNIVALPPGEAKNRLIKQLGEYGVDLDQTVGGKTLQEWIDDGDGDEEAWYQKFFFWKDN